MYSSSSSDYSDFEGGHHEEFESSSSNDFHHPRKETILTTHPMIEYGISPQLPVSPGYAGLPSPRRQESQQEYIVSPEMRRRMQTPQHHPQHHREIMAESRDMYQDSPRGYSASPELRRRMQTPQHPQMMMTQQQVPTNYRLDQNINLPNIKVAKRNHASVSPERRRHGNSNYISVDSARNNLMNMAEMSKANPDRFYPWDYRGRSQSPRNSNSHEMREEIQYNNNGRSQSPEKRYSHERSPRRFDNNTFLESTPNRYNRNLARNGSQDRSPSRFESNIILESTPTSRNKSPKRCNGRDKSPEKRSGRDKSPSRLKNNSILESNPDNYNRNLTRRISRDRSPARFESNSILGRTPNSRSQSPKRRSGRDGTPKRHNSHDESPKRRNDRDTNPTRLEDNSILGSTTASYIKSPKRFDNKSPLVKKLTSDDKSPKKRDSRSRNRKRMENNSTLVSKLTSDSKSPKRRNSRDGSPKRGKNNITLVSKLTHDSKSPKRRGSRGKNNKQIKPLTNKLKRKKAKKNGKINKERSRSGDSSSYSPVNGRKDGYNDQRRKVYEDNSYFDHDDYFERKQDLRSYNSWDKREESLPFECVEVGIDNEISWYQGPCTGNPCGRQTGYSSEHSDSDCSTFRTTKGHAPPRTSNSDCCCTGPIAVPPWALVVGGVLVLIVSL